MPTATETKVKHLRLLLVEDSKDDAEELLQELRCAPFEVEHRRVDSEDGMRLALCDDWDVVISNYKTRAFGAVAALAVLKDTGADIPFIMISATIAAESVVDAFHAGANDLVLKSALARLVPAVQRGLHEREMKLARIQKERALRESEARYKRMIDTSNDGVWMVDTAANTLFVNERTAAMLGYASAAMIGRPVLEFIDESSRGDAERVFRRRERQGSVQSEVLCRCKDGSELWVLIDSAPSFDAHGSYEGALAMLMNITERKHLEEQLRQKQKLEAIGALAGGIAHDFNNILAVIFGYAGMLLEEMRPGDPVRDDIDEIAKAAQRAATLTQQLLAFSRRQVLRPTTVNLNQVLDGVLSMLRRACGENVELVLTPAEDLGRIVADASQIEQVLMNLVVNARDAMPDGGNITLSTQNVTVDTASASVHQGVPAGDYVMVALSDSGQGIDDATRARIFEPFFTTKERGKGTGLGLSTVFGIVKQSHAHITVASRVGHGTRFSIYFPETDRRITTLRPPPVTATSGGGDETILLVEDEEPVRVMIRTLLTRSGYSVLEAQNGGEAFLVCERHPGDIHLLLTDVVMPRMSGHELVARISPMRPRMRILYMSGYMGPMSDAGISDSRIDVLQKPFTPDRLSAKVREVLDAVGVPMLQPVWPG